MHCKVDIHKQITVKLYWWRVQFQMSFISTSYKLETFSFRMINIVILTQCENRQAITYTCGK